MRPAGGGIHTVSTGKAEQLEMQKRLYGASSEASVREAWLNHLQNLQDAEAVVLGVPSDVGAGFRRGASFGPQAIREQLLRDQAGHYCSSRVVDVGDVFVVPQLLEDEMLSDAQLRATRAALYEDAESELPVSPLSIAADAIAALQRLAPNAVPLVLGGDHSVSWPVVQTLATQDAQLGILHFDAHTDLLETRLGIRTCFATWAYHANELIGRSGRLVQVGIRISGRSREHWESTLAVRQIWSAEAYSGLGGDIVDWLREAGVERLYISNDIDGTDPRFAAATGTPEPGGLLPEVVCELIETVGAAFDVVGSDVVEVAPPLNSEIDDEPARTLKTAASYVEAQLAVSCSASGEKG